MYGLLTGRVVSSVVLLFANSVVELTATVFGGNSRMIGIEVEISATPEVIFLVV